MRKEGQPRENWEKEGQLVEKQEKEGQLGKKQEKKRQSGEKQERKGQLREKREREQLVTVSKGGSRREKEDDTDFCAIWDQSRRMSPNHGRREQAMHKIRQAVENKTFFHTPSYPEMLLVELQYISPYFWVLQGIFVAVLVILLETAGGNGSAASRLQGTAESLENLAGCLQWTSVIAAWMGVAGCSQLSRHFSKGMAELEQSCFFNLAQMWTIRMVLTGIVDLMILTLCSGRIAERTNMPFGSVCLYVLVPFVLANVCCMLFFTALRGGRSRYVQLVLAFVTGVLSAVPSVTPSEAYAQSAVWTWAAVLAGGAGVYLWQLRCMYGKIKRGDVVCWN